MGTFRSGWGFGVIFFFLGAQVAQASVDSVPNDPLAPELFKEVGGMSTSRRLTPTEAFSRTQAVLEHFGVEPEADRDDEIRQVEAMQTLEGLKARLPYLDPDQQFARFMNVDASHRTGILECYRDRDSKNVRDFSVALAPSGSEDRISSPFQQRLERARNNPASRPLEGLRIALDPGHMGTELWDTRTGKWIKDPSGNKLSEGVLAMQTAVLLERELVELGAEVYLTRRGMKPVSDVAYEDLDIRSHAQMELRSSSLQKWFVDLLGTGPAGSALYKAFESHAKVKAMFSESARSNYFILRSDLKARSDKMAEFRPDLTLILHYDVSVTPENPHGLSRGYNKTKAYVPGSLMTEELATREDRRLLATHLMDLHAWRASVDLSKSILAQVKSRLGIDYDPSGASPATVRVAPGVYTRNLGVARRMTGHAVTYLETLFYNDPTEFKKLLPKKHPLMIDGVNYPYSDRMIEIVTAMKDGVVNFVRGSSRETVIP